MSLHPSRQSRFPIAPKDKAPLVHPITYSLFDPDRTAVLPKSLPLYTTLILKPFPVYTFWIEFLPYVLGKVGSSRTNFTRSRSNTLATLVALLKPLLTRKGGRALYKPLSALPPSRPVNKAQVRPLLRK